MVLKKKAAKASSRTAKSSKPGTYTVPRGNVSIAIPAFWVFRQTNDDLQLVSPSGDVSLIVNAYSGNNKNGTLDARQSLDHLLASAPKGSRIKREAATKKRAAARYKDSDGTSWCVEFITDGRLLLLAEISSTEKLTSPEAKTALTALNSIAIKNGR